MYKNETRYALAADPTTFKVLAPRARDVEYDADHFGGRWVIRTNADGATNFKLVEAPSAATSRGQWTDLVPHDPKVFIEGVELFDATVDAQKAMSAIVRTGERFGMADIVLGPYAYVWMEIAVERPDHPALVDWYRRLASRPAWAMFSALSATTTSGASPAMICMLRRLYSPTVPVTVTMFSVMAFAT